MIKPYAQLAKGAGRNFAYYSMQLYDPGDPKGGAWPNAPPPKYAPDNDLRKNNATNGNAMLPDQSVAEKT